MNCSLGKTYALATYLFSNWSKIQFQQQWTKGHTYQHSGGDSILARASTTTSTPLRAKTIPTTILAAGIDFDSDFGGCDSIPMAMLEIVRSIKLDIYVDVPSNASHNGLDPTPLRPSRRPPLLLQERLPVQQRGGK